VRGTDAATGGRGVWGPHPSGGVHGGLQAAETYTAKLRQVADRTTLHNHLEATASLHHRDAQQASAEGRGVSSLAQAVRRLFGRG
jgi:hypothetical protein